MNKYYKIRLSFFFISTLFILHSCEEKKENHHQPTKPDGFFDYEAFEYNDAQKKYKHDYKEQLYFAHEDLNVDSIRQSHMEDRIKNRQLRPLALDQFANGTITGTWHERGPINEAGDMREIDYDRTDDSLYAISTAGHLWKGSLNGNKWRVLNDKIRFSTDALAHIKKNNTDRIIAVYGANKQNKIPRYSDNMGLTWNLPNGIGDGFHDAWGSPKKIIETDDGKSLFYMVNTWKSTPWGSAIEVYKTTDWGENYELVLSLNGGGYNKNDVDMWKPENQDLIYIVDNYKKKLYTIQYNPVNGSSTLSSPQSLNGLGNGEINLTGRFTNNNVTLFALIAKNTVYKLSAGNNWENLGTVTINNETKTIFRNVFMANPTNNQLYMGGFQFYKSNDEKNWEEQYDYWWTYYDKAFALPERKDNMHVDMMDMKFFRKADNTPFFTILNHAGVYVSYDNMLTTKNIGQTDLNVVTLYDHVTAPDGSMFFGAQDKGTFRNIDNSNSSTEKIESENMTTGDGMREIIFNDGKSWFGFLQNGSMICMPDIKSNTQKWWQVPGDDIPGWINPVENHPDPSAKKCYVAGGNINGGSGSYLIEMNVSWTNNGSNFQWSPKQFNYDFKTNSKNGTSVIKALSASTKDYNKLYVATKDASFFTSNDAGNSWQRSNYDLPSNMIPWDIIVSPSDAQKVFVCGTGWSNEGVWMSTDAGNTFTPLDQNSVSATYFDMVLSPDEKFLYTATSEGPYVYSFEENSWFSLAGSSTPLVDFRSIEFIESIQTIRFGTYGRGVWDFQLQSEIVTDCNGTENGTAFMDSCTVCVEGTTGKSACQTPYTNHRIPGIIEAEAFDFGGEGISYHDITLTNSGGQLRLTEAVDIGAVNTGGYYIGWTSPKEWIEYTVNIEEETNYHLIYTYASPRDGNSFYFELDGNKITPSIIFNTSGGWQKWQQEAFSNIHLPSGEHILRLVIEAGSFDIDKLEFVKETITSTSNSSKISNQIFPNPAKDFVSIKTQSNTSISILSADGKTIKNLSGKGSYSLNLSEWKRGNYTVIFTQNGKTKTQQLIVD